MPAKIDRDGDEKQVMDANPRLPYGQAMSRLQKLRDMKPQEVERAHRIFNKFVGDDEKVIEAIADLRAYCGNAWPKMLEEALRRYRKSQRGGEA